MKAAVMVSDGRMRVIAEELGKDGLDVLVCDSREDMERLEKEAGEMDVLLLPIRGIDGEGYASIPGVRFPMERIMGKLKPEAIVITGLQTEYLRRMDRKIHCYFEDEQVHWTNVCLTAEGILYLLLKETKKSIFELTVDLVGYGYVGKAAHNLLKKLEISHRLVDKEAGIAEDGWEVISIDQWKKDIPAQVIVNSAPVLVADEATAEKWPGNLVFIDVASGAPGACEEIKEKIHYVAAPPLPGLVAEESAGRMLTDYVRRQIKL